MKRLFSFVGAMGTVLLASAQLTSISVETVLEHDGSIAGIPDGYTTYRIYANLTNEYDFVSAVYGDAESPLSLQFTGDILQVPEGGGFASDINPLFFEFFPALEYDSWLTIDAMFSGDGEGTISTAIAPGLEPFNDFENGEGFLINDPFGASWFTTFNCANPVPDLETCAEGKIGFAGTDLKVLLAQITTDGELYGIFNVQVFANGIQANEQLASGFPFSSVEGAIFGCTDASATNYNASATIDDESCVFPCELELLEESLTLASPVCAGGNEGIIQIEAAGAQGADDFYLDDLNSELENFGNFSGLLSGPHTIYVVDGVGCIDSLEVVIPAVEPVTMTAELTTAVSCHNAADGVITITDVSGGDGNYTFGISSNPTELSSDLVWEGIGTTNGNNQTYSFTVFDGNGCSGSSEGVFVTNPQEMFVSLANTNPVIDATCANIQDGQIYLTALGGGTNSVGPFEFSVDGENFAPSPLSVTGGTFTVTARDPLGCTATLANEVVVGPPAILVNAAVEPELCSGDENGEVSWTPTNGDGTYTFTFNGEATTETLAGDLAPGTYTVVVTDGEGCTGEETVEVEAALAISVTTDAVDASCFEDNDGSITVNADGGSGSFLYSEDGNNFIQNNEFGGFSAGSYTLFVQDEFGCVETGSATVGEPDAIVITGIVSEGSATGEGTIDVTVTGGNLPYEYEWIGQGVSGQNTQDLDGISSGSYTVEVTDANGCSSIETFNITTDLREIEAGVLATVYPNPSQGLFTVDIMGGMQGQVQYQVVDAQGRQILNGQWNASEGFFRVDLDLSAAEAGMYRLVMMANGRPSSLQLIKTH
jgi:hypothetical protein